MESPQAFRSATFYIVELKEYLVPGFLRALHSQGFLEDVWECRASLGGGRGWGRDEGLFQNGCQQSPSLRAETR